MTRPETLQPAATQAGLDRAKVLLWAFVPGYLLLHGIVATQLPGWLNPLSTCLIVLAEWIAIAACLRARRSMGPGASGFWLLLAGAIVIHSAAMGMDAATEIAQTPVLNHVAGIQTFLSMLYNVPLLVAVSIQNDRRMLPVARTIHALLSVAIGVVIYVQIFSFLTVHGSTNPADAIVVMHLFDAIDVFLAVAATIRWLGSGQGAERRFFGILTIFLWANGILPAIHNRILIRHDYIWLDLLLSAPYVMLVPLVLSARNRPVRKPSPVLARAVRSGSPVFLASTLVVAGVFAARSDFFLGLAAALVAIVSYGTLNIVVQSRGIAAEESLMASKAALHKLAKLDGLTGIANRRAFDEAFEREFALTLRTQQPVSLLMIDVDLFKDLNDLNGHVAGDDCLMRIASMLRSTLPRATDLVARYGGDEFSVILPMTDDTGALVVAEKVRKGVVDLSLDHPTTSLRLVTVSVGVSTFEGSDQFAPADLTGAADRALYRAKRDGRNCSVFQRMDDSRNGKAAS